MNKSNDSDGYYAWKAIKILLPMMIFCWGIVAPLINTNKDIGPWPLVFYINLVALPTLVLLISIQHCLGQTDRAKKISANLGLSLASWNQFGLKKTGLKTYAEISAIGVIWPCVYSYCFFRAIITGGQGSGAMATTLNYTWPIFALVCTMAINRLIRKKAADIAWPSIVATVIAVLAIVVMFWLEKDNVQNLNAFMLIALTAAATQGFFNSYNNLRNRLDPWVVTLTVEVATVLVSGVFMLITNGFQTPLSTKNLWAVIGLGVAANGIGFWVFVAGAQISAKLAERLKNNIDQFWNLGNCLVLPAALILMPYIGKEPVPASRWGVALMVVICLVLERVVGRMIKPKQHDNTNDSDVRPST